MKKILPLILILILLSTIALAEELTDEELQVLMQDPEIAALLEQNPNVLDYLNTGEEFTSSEEVQRQIIQAQLEQLKNDWNQNAEEVPGIVVTLFGNEEINIYLEDEILASVEMKDGKITNINENELEKPTINMYLTKEFMDKLAKGETDPVQGVQNGDVQIQGQKFFTKIKLWVTSKVINLFL